MALATEESSWAFEQLFHALANAYPDNRYEPKMLMADGDNKITGGKERTATII